MLEKYMPYVEMYNIIITIFFYIYSDVNNLLNQSAWEYSLAVSI